MTALEGVPDAAIGRERALASIVRAQNRDGSWGYLTGQPGAPEPTVLAVAAGLAPPLPWLEGASLGWATLLLPAALAGVEPGRAIRGKALEQILAARQPSMPRDDGGVVGHDASIAAWPWYPDTAAWVEPTSYALVSLKRCGVEAADPARVAERIALGEAMLRDRRCSDGGWNYGNPYVRDEPLPGDLSITGWAVLALGARLPELAPALDLLLSGRAAPSVSRLSLAILARVAAGADPFDLPDALLARQAADGSFGGRVDRTALAACALGAVCEGTHAFVV
jgi:hypothetical protein